MKYFIIFLVFIFIFQSCVKPEEGYEYICVELKNNIEIQGLLKKTKSSDYTKTLPDLKIFMQEYKKINRKNRMLLQNEIKVDSTTLTSCPLVVDEIVFDLITNLINGIKINIDSLTRAYEIRCKIRNELISKETKMENEAMHELIVQNDSRCMIRDTLDLFFLVSEDNRIWFSSCFIPPDYLLFFRQIYLKVILLDKKSYYELGVPSKREYNQVDDVVLTCQIIELNLPFVEYQTEQLKERSRFIFSLQHYCHLIK